MSSDLQNGSFSTTSTTSPSVNMYGNGKYVCPLDQCGQSFTYLSEFAVHRHIHMGEKPFRCTACVGPRYFAQTNDLISHMVVMHNHPCSLCSQTFTRLEDQVAHERIVHKYSCPLCHLKFTDRFERDQHVPIEHYYTYTHDYKR